MIQPCRIMTTTLPTLFSPQPQTTQHEESHCLLRGRREKEVLNHSMKSRTSTSPERPKAKQNHIVPDHRSVTAEWAPRSAPAPGEGLWEGNILLGMSPVYLENTHQLWIWNKLGHGAPSNADAVTRHQCKLVANLDLRHHLMLKYEQQPWAQSK